MPANVKNPAIKRIHADVRELLKDPSDQYYAAPLEDNLFEWHFTLRGPAATAFEGGVYHGRILLPPEYPFRPPDIIFSTPNGRFKVGTKICLTISSYHPEYWQPAWGIRLILEALISFFPSPSKGALGGLDWLPAERQRLAKDSTIWKCYKCGLAKDLLPELKTHGGANDGQNKSQAGNMCTSGRYAKEIEQLHAMTVKTEEDVARETRSEQLAEGNEVRGEIRGRSAERDDVRSPAESDVSEAETQRYHGETDANGGRVPSAHASNKDGDTPLDSLGEAAEYGGSSGSRRVDTRDAAEANSSFHGNGGTGCLERGAHRALEKEQREKEDELLTYVAVALAVAIAGILVRKFLRWLGFWA